jgi:hypothetical protein
MTKQLTAAILGLTAILSATSVRADYVVYTNRASFESAIASEKTETFNELGSNVQNYGSSGLSQANGLLQPLSITASSGFLLSASAASFSGDYPANGTYLIGPISTSTTDGITVTLPANTYSAAGADVAGFTSNSVVSVLVTTSDGSSFNSSVMVDARSANSSLGFLGVVLTTPGDFVTSLTFSTPVGASQNVMIDNVSFGSAVPEPASIALLVTGSLAIGTAALRRRLRKRLA